MRKRRGEKIMWMLKSLLASYIVTGLLLLGLTFLVYKFELDEQVVVAGIVAIYVVSTFMGGYIIGKLTGAKKYIWGMIVGAVYFALLFFMVAFSYFFSPFTICKTSKKINLFLLNKLNIKR